MARKIRYGVVGGGEISQLAFMPGIARTTNSELTALVTGDPTKADQLARQYTLKTYRYEQFADLLASGTVDALYIATPNFRHAEFAVPALRAGIHVLLEKPMEVSEAACQAILDAQKGTAAKLMIAYRLHFEPGTVAMMDLAHNGTLGAPVSFTSTFGQNVSKANHRAANGYWAGPVADMGPYPINAVRNLFLDEPIEVSALGSHTPGRQMDLHDVVAVTLRFPHDRLAQFTVSYTGGSINEFTLIGTEGSLHASPAYTYGPKTPISYTTRIGETEETQKHGPVEQFGGEAEYFSDCILEDRDPEPDGIEGLMDVRVLAAIESALQTGTPQTLAPTRKRGRILPTQAISLRVASPPDGVDVVPIKD